MGVLHSPRMNERKLGPGRASPELLNEERGKPRLIILSLFCLNVDLDNLPAITDENIKWCASRMVEAYLRRNQKIENCSAVQGLLETHGHECKAKKHNLVVLTFQKINSTNINKSGNNHHTGKRKD